MMGKINLDKVNSFEPIKPERQSDVKSVQSPPIRPEKTDISNEKDRVNLSGKAAEVGKLVGKVKDLPEVRSDRVEALKAQVEAGEFDPTSEQIANAIIKDEQA